MPFNNENVRKPDPIRMDLIEARIDRDISNLLGLHLPKASVEQRALAHIGIADIIVAGIKGKL